MEPERLFILLLFGIPVLVSLASRWLRWRQGQVRRPGSPAGGPVAGKLPEEPPPSPWPPRPAPALRRVEPPRAILAEPPVPPERPEGPPLPRTFGPPRRRARNQGLFRTPADARRAIVLMSVLGPCRGLDPPGGGEAGLGQAASPRRR